MARPSEEDLARWDEHVFQREKNIEQAMPWKDALGKALASEAVEIIQFIFLTTYKHHISDAEKGHAISLESEAMDFLKRWKKVKEACKKAELDTSELTEAIYRFTNSDWAQVSAARGPGLDNVATAKEYQAWAMAVIAAGIKAIKAGRVPSSEWHNQARSYLIHEHRDLDKVTLPNSYGRRF